MHGPRGSNGQEISNVDKPGDNLWSQMLVIFQSKSFAQTLGKNEFSLFFVVGNGNRP